MIRRREVRRRDHRADRAPAQPQQRLRGAAQADGPGVLRARLMTGVGYRLLASANFGQLVLFRIDADFCKQILIFQRFSRSTRFAILRTAPNSKISETSVKIFAINEFFKDFCHI